jgi:hypothetical protein
MSQNSGNSGEKHFHCVGFEVIKAKEMSTVFWDITLCC